VNTDADPQFGPASYVQVGSPGSKSDVNAGPRASLDVVDWNNDGRLDLVVGAMDGKVRVLLDEAASGEPDFRSVIVVQDGAADLTVPTARSSPAVYDLDGDGRKDLIAGNTAGQVLFYANTGTDAAPAFDTSTPLQSGGVPIDLPGTPRSRPWVGDYNADGAADLLVGAYDGLVRLVAGELLTPAPFDILGPTGTVDDPTPEITWGVSAGATGYDVVISTEPDLSTPVVEFFDVAETSVTPADPLDDGTYYIGVTAVGPNQDPQVDAGPDVTIGPGQWLVGAGSFTDPDHRVEATNNGLSFEVGPAAYHRIFVTSSRTNIDPSEAFPPPYPRWGGLPAADWAVTYHAYLAGFIPNWDGLAIVYKAVLSTQTEYARDRLVIEGPIINTAGQTVADSAAEFWSGNLQNAINYDEDAVAVPAASAVWTGASPDGTHSGSSCGAWNQLIGSGTIGRADSSSDAWANVLLQDCNESARLYAISPPLGIAPTVDAGGDAVAVIDQPFTRDGTFEDRGDVYWKATVDYGDGAGPQTLPLDFEAHAFRLDHTYTTAGPHTVTVTINDSDPGTDAAVATFEVAVGEGVAAADVGWVEARDPRVEDIGGELTRGSRASTHPTALAAAALDAASWSATVDYDDGAGPVALVLNPDKTFALSHQYNDPGTYTVTVTVTDDEGAVGSDTLQVTVPDPPQVVGRYVFYGGSSHGTTIAPDKTPLLPGTAGSIATAANYTSYSRGINGLAVDLANLPPDVTPAADDFAFHTGNDNHPAGWTELNVEPIVTLDRGAGVDGSDRVTITLPDGAVANAWLQVTILPTAGCPLPAADVFYYGNAVAEAGDSATAATVTITDLLLARNNPRGFLTPVDITFPYDHDRDGRVDAVDVLLARNNQTSFFDALKLIDLRGEGDQGSGVGGQGEEGSGSLEELAWLAEQGLNRAEANERATAAQDAVDLLLEVYWGE